MGNQEVFDILPLNIRRQMYQLVPDDWEIREIRMRVGQPLIINGREKEQLIRNEKGRPYIVEQGEIGEMLEYISHYSLYAYEEEMKQGFITIEGGHRIGLTGQAIFVDGKIRNLKNISSVNIRMAHEVIGCGEKVLPYIVCNGQICHTLIISPPCCGKTTLLRDMIRIISNGSRYCKGKTVGVVDERSEIAGCYHGVPQNHLGIRTDVLDGCPKGYGMILLIRSMSPQVVAVDEIGASEDVRSMEYAMHCGCKMIATAHGRSLEELSRKPVFNKLIGEKCFERYIILGADKESGEVLEVLDSSGKNLLKESGGEIYGHKNNRKYTDRTVCRDDRHTEGTGIHDEIPGTIDAQKDIPHHPK